MNRSEIAALSLALVVHTGGLLLAKNARGPNLFGENLATSLDLVEIEVPATPRPKEEPNSFTPEGVPNIHVPIDRRVAANTGGTVSNSGINPNPGDPSSGGNPGDEGVVTGPGEPGPGDWTGPPAEGWLPPGFGASGPIYANPELFAMVPRGPGAPTQAPKAKEVDRDIANKVIKDELRRQDKKLGLDLPAAGTVASMFRAAVLASEAPSTARAAFQVALGPGGKVRSVKLISASAGQVGTWEAIAASVKAALAAQKLALNGDYAKGALIVVNVQSKMQMPSGAKVDAGIELSLTQTFDISDIGAKPVRVVSAQASATPVE